MGGMPPLPEVFEYRGYSIKLERRYYSKTDVYTWIYVNNRQVCDPVRKRRPSNKDLDFAIKCYNDKFNAEVNVNDCGQTTLDSF